MAQGRSDERHVSRQSFEAAGKSWPFTVSEGAVGCTRATDIPGAPRSWTTIHRHIPWFRAPNGQRYALAQFAFGRVGFLDPTPIWIVDRERARREGASERQLIWYRASWLDLLAEAEALCR